MSIGTLTGNIQTGYATNVGLGQYGVYFGSMYIGTNFLVDTGGNGTFGGVGLTNGAWSVSSMTTPLLTVSTNMSISGSLTASSITFTNLVGDGSGLTNINSSAVVATNIVTWIDAGMFLGGNYNNIPFNGSSVYFAASSPPIFSSSYYCFSFPSGTGGFGIRINPSMTGSFTNMAATIYLVATNTTILENMNAESKIQNILNTVSIISGTSFAIGTLTNGVNPRTVTFKVSPGTSNWFSHTIFYVNTGSFTNTVWCMGVKLEAY